MAKSEIGAYIILYYFAEYLTPMLTLDPRSYRSSNLVLDLKMWEKLESNLPVCNSKYFRMPVCWKASLNG